MRRLTDWFCCHPGAALAFSGGSDSALLLYAALQAKINVRIFMVQSQFQHTFERQDALLLADSLGARVSTLPCDILVFPEVVANDPMRCYHCKKHLFSCLQKSALEEGCTCIVDGSNASDDPVARPGMRALEEMHVLSPLRECGFKKETIRVISREAKLPTWNRPSNACLATRIPVGTTITLADLRRIERAEDLLRQMGFSDLRVRLYHKAARIQLPQAQLEQANAMRKEIVSLLAGDFDAVLLDLKSR